jgi:dTDP-4-amino-4,6-dideoxygalactose transaminase
MTTSAVATRPQTPFPSDQDASGRTLGGEEIALLAEAVESGILTSTKGRFVKTLERDFAGLLGVGHALAVGSGTAAIHTAVAALDAEPGDEVVTSPITDMGALAPILYQGLIPVFADVDPVTCTVTADTVAARLGPRTRAVVVTHLFGYPCELGGIVRLARAHGIPVIEDCSQAYLARDRGRLVGTIGTVGIFSLQQGKHIPPGEGGFVTTNDDGLARRMRLFANKGWGYGDADPDHYFLALNYRMTELQGAVGLAQLPKLQSVVDRRNSIAATLTAALADCPGLETPVVPPGSRHAYWRYPLRVADTVPGGPEELGRRLAARGIVSAPRYIKKPAFRCAVFREQRTFGTSRYPFTLARPEALDYDLARFPGTVSGLDGLLVLPVNERYTGSHVDYLAESLHAAVDAARESRR